MGFREAEKGREFTCLTWEGSLRLILLESGLGLRDAGPLHPAVGCAIPPPPTTPSPMPESLIPRAISQERPGRTWACTRMVPCCQTMSAWGLPLACKFCSWHIGIWNVQPLLNGELTLLFYTVPYKTRQLILFLSKKEALGPGFGLIPLSKSRLSKFFPRVNNSESVGYPISVATYQRCWMSLEVFIGNLWTKKWTQPWSNKTLFAETDDGPTPDGVARPSSPFLPSDSGSTYH